MSSIRGDSFTGGVNFAGSLDDLERANLHLRARLVDSIGVDFSVALAPPVSPTCWALLTICC